MNSDVVNIVADTMSRLEPDPWRQEVGFTDEVAKANARLFNSRNEEEAAGVLNTWISSHQPCLFGRHAAKIGMLSYCILSESDLEKDDRYIRDRIQSARRLWTRQAFNGLKSGFIILALSERLAMAKPSVHVMELAQRLCSLYLLEPVEADQIYLESLELEVPGKESPTFRWDAGVNYFCAQGDGRWWRDHRIPGGLSFSVNSVGQMVKSTRVSIGMKDLHMKLGVSEEEWSESTVDSLGKALLLAMQTITKAADTPDGRATELLPLPTDLSELPSCPITLPDKLANSNYCEYSGKYHTDVTLPSEYFLDDVRHPAALSTHRLDLTYLFDGRLDNPDFINVGEGRQVRTEDESVDLSARERHLKRSKAVGRVISRQKPGD